MKPLDELRNRLDAVDGRILDALREAGRQILPSGRLYPVVVEPEA